MHHTSLHNYSRTCGSDARNMLYARLMHMLATPFSSSLHTLLLPTSPHSFTRLQRVFGGQRTAAASRCARGTVCAPNQLASHTLVACELAAHLVFCSWSKLCTPCAAPTTIPPKDTASVQPPSELPLHALFTHPFNSTQQLHSRPASTPSSTPSHCPPDPPPAAPTSPLAPLPHIQPRSAPLPNPPPPSTHCEASKSQHLNHPRRKSPAASSWKESKQLDSHETKTTAPSRPKPLLLKKQQVTA